jgi:hypothetical protein
LPDRATATATPAAGSSATAPPGLALIHAGDQYISHTQFDLTAILPAPIPAADRARLVQQMARAFGVPLTVVDPHRMRAELELRGPNPAPSYPSRLALCAELGRDQRWLGSGHRPPAGRFRGRGRYSSP